MTTNEGWTEYTGQELPEYVEYEYFQGGLVRGAGRGDKVAAMLPSRFRELDPAVAVALGLSAERQTIAKCTPEPVPDPDKADRCANCGALQWQFADGDSFARYCSHCGRVEHGGSHRWIISGIDGKGATDG